MRQAYDYWQDQPGNSLKRIQVRIKFRPEKQSLKCSALKARSRDSILQSYVSAIILNDVHDHSKERQTTNDFPVRRVSTFGWTRDFGARRTKSIMKQYNRLRARGSPFQLFSSRTALSPSIGREGDKLRTLWGAPRLSAQCWAPPARWTLSWALSFSSPHIDLSAAAMIWNESQCSSIVLQQHKLSKYTSWAGSSTTETAVNW